MIRLYTDAAVSGNPGYAGIGLLFIFDKKQKQFSVPLKNNSWNNHLAEFHALEHAIQHLVKLGKTDEMVFCYTDSKVLADAIDKKYVKNKYFNDYLQSILNQMKEFPYISVQWIPSQENKGADNLARQALRAAQKS